MYEVEVSYVLSYFKPRLAHLQQLKEINFKGTKFVSNSYDKNSKEIVKLDFSMIFDLPNLSSLNLSYTNFFEVISEINLKLFCDKLKTFTNLLYLGLASTQQQFTNSRKY